jgi:hypothetical protein
MPPGGIRPPPLPASKLRAWRALCAEGVTTFVRGGLPRFVSATGNGPRPRTKITKITKAFVVFVSFVVLVLSPSAVQGIYLGSSLRPASRLSKFRIALNTMK